MKINQVLVESTQASVAFAFGRFNPAHQGHIEVWRTVEDAGKNWFVGTNPNTIGPNDPLTFQQKSAWMEEIYPPISGHIVAQSSVLTLAAYIFNKLRKNANTSIAYVTDDTDWAWSGKLLNQYNGVEGSHGYYKFAEIIHVPSPRVSSATALRDAARADDKVAFYHASGTDPKSKVAGLTYFDTVKQACEKYPLPVKKVNKVKEKNVAEETLNEIDPGLITNMFAVFPTVSKIIMSNALAKANKEKNETAHMISVLTKIVSGEKVPPEEFNTAHEQFKDLLQYGIKAIVPAIGGGVLAGISAIYKKELLSLIKNKGPEAILDMLKNQNIDVVKSLYGKFLGKNAIGFYSAPVTEDEQKTVAKTWNQMTPQEKISGVKGRTVWNEKTKKYYTVFDVPAKEVDEASLETMRNYFAGDDDARDPYEITKQRLHFSKDKNAKATVMKKFRSQAEYEDWLRQNKLKPITGVKEDEEAGEVKKTGQLIPFPAGTTKVAVSDVYDWYKLGQVISDLDDANPADFGQGAPETVIAFGSEEEENKLLPLLQRLGLKLKDIDQPVEEAYHAGSLYDMLKDINK